ncbi:MAG TPA: hypothetical protein VNU92_04240 [Edaphobacter sp.]|nr:hypothetical protein [Edaphobacter sp.]
MRTTALYAHRGMFVVPFGCAGTASTGSNLADDLANDYSVYFAAYHADFFNS